MGQKEGEWLFFHENGTPSKTLNLQKNNLNGKQSYYYENGHPKKIINYKEGTFNGSYKTYYKDSILKMSKFFKKWNNQWR